MCIFSKCIAPLPLPLWADGNIPVCRSRHAAGAGSKTNWEQDCPRLAACANAIKYFIFKTIIMQSQWSNTKTEWFWFLTEYFALRIGSSQYIAQSPTHPNNTINAAGIFIWWKYQCFSSALTSLDVLKKVFIRLYVMQFWMNFAFGKLFH